MQGWAAVNTDTTDSMQSWAAQFAQGLQKATLQQRMGNARLSRLLEEMRRRRRTRTYPPEIPKRN
jgi:hypothetical protein